MILVLFLIACLYPLLWLIMNSFKTQEELFTNTWGFPRVWTLENYKHAVVDGKIGIYFLNSVVVSVISVAGTIVLSVMASYGVTFIIRDVQESFQSKKRDQAGLRRISSAPISIIHKFSPR